MKIELSKEAIDIILTALETVDDRCNWELSCLPPQHKIDNTKTFQYWTQRQETIKKALKEFRRAI